MLTSVNTTKLRIIHDMSTKLKKNFVILCKISHTMESLTTIQHKILDIRGHKVILDRDLAAMYGVETKVLNQAVKRNIERFPIDFMFQLDVQEMESLRTQIVTLKIGRGKHSKYLPYAFTEHGVAMLSGVLKSPTAVQVNIAIIRAFVAMRQMVVEARVLPMVQL